MTKSLSQMSNEELWQLFPIMLKAHREEWKQWYEDERSALVRLIGEENIDRISHIGSTSVPELIAKPTIDILLEISSGCCTQRLKETLERSGYIFSPQPSNPPPHMMFMKGYTPQGFEEKVFHIHVRFKADWDELYFCEYLRRHPDAAAQYGELKIQLKEKFEHDRDAYTEEKADFIKRVTNMAKEEEKRLKNADDGACAVGIIGGADGPTAVFVSKAKRSRKHEKQRDALLKACEKMVVASECLKTGDELKEYLINTLGAVEMEPMPHQLRALKLNALMNHHREALHSPAVPEENAPREDWIDWAKKTHLSYTDAAQRLPDDVFGFRYAFLRLPYNDATKKYYRSRKKESRGPFLSRLKSLFDKWKDKSEITLDIELATGQISMGNGCALLMNHLILWRGITQQDIDQRTPQFEVYAAAFKDMGKIKMKRDKSR